MGQRLDSFSTSLARRGLVVKGLIALGVIVVVVIVGYAAGIKVATVKNLKTIEDEQKSQEFNPSSYVDARWESAVIPTILDKAVDFTTLMAAIKADQQAAIDQYGHSETGAYNFMTKGQGKVIAYNDATSSRTLDVDVEPYDGQKDLSIQIGPVLTGFSLRDSTGVITFNTVANQIEYGQINRELNSRVAALFKDLNPADLQDKVISFYGTFTLTDPAAILLTPIQIEVVEGD